MSSETVAFAGRAVVTAPVPGSSSAPGARRTLVALPEMAPPPRPQLPPQDTKEQAAVSAQIDTFVRSAGRDLNFQVDAASGRTIVTVRDAGGGVVRMIPDATQLRVAAMIDRGLGVLFDGKA